MRDPDAQLALAEEVFGDAPVVELYRQRLVEEAAASILSPQALYALMRVLLAEGYDAPIEQDLTGEERTTLLSAVVASGSVLERDLDTNIGATPDDLLAYELQVGSYYARPTWLEEMARHRELYRLATSDDGLLKSRDVVPVERWLTSYGLDAHEQWQWGFALSTQAHAWDASRHPHVPSGRVADTLERLGLTERTEAALPLISADRHELTDAFSQLDAAGRAVIWELRPFNTKPFLRLADGGLVLLGRPFMLSWLGEGFHYRALRVAQSKDGDNQDGRTDHVQRYTAYAGQVFEQYCLEQALAAVPPPAIVLGEQPYGRGGEKKTSDVAVLIGEDLLLFEANARRVGAQPLITGDPLDATEELTKLVVKKINQLGVCIGGLLSGDAQLPGIKMGAVKRIWPVVVAQGHVWQTSHLWRYLDSARDSEKCKPLREGRVQPLQLLDAGDYEMLLALAAAGNSLPGILAGTTSIAYRERDLAVWLNQSKNAPDHHVRLASLDAVYTQMSTELEAALRPG